MAVVGKIKRLEISGGFLGGLTLDFSARLNCLIGSRGSGKTTLLEILRLVLSDGAESSLSPLADKLLRSNLGPFQVRASVEYDDAPGVDYTFIKQYNKDKQCDLNGSIIEPRRFPVSIYSTDEIEDVAVDKDGSRKRDLIDSFNSERVIRLKTDITIARNKVRENTTNLVNLRAEADKLSDEVSPLPIWEDKLSHLVGGAEEVLDGEYKAEEDLERKRNLEKRAVESTLEIINKIDKTLESTISEVLALKVNPINTLPSDTPNANLVGAVASIVNQKVERIVALVRSEQGTSNKEIQSVSSLARDLDNVHKEQIVRYLDLQARHAEKTAKVREISEAESKVTELREKKARHEALLANIKAVSEERRQLMSLLDQKLEELFQIRLDMANEINASFLDDANGQNKSNLLVEVAKGADKGSYLRSLQVALQGSNLRYGQLVDKIVEKTSPESFVDRVLTEDLAWFRTELGVDEARAQTIVRHLVGQYDVLLNLAITEIDDQVSISLNISDDKSKPVYQESSRLSTGQKCTAILPILLMATDQGPLIIDQPENNLDNQYIFTDIVPQLEAIKRSRQLIFVTHNPNIPVLADAEAVFVLTADTVVDNGKEEIRGRVVQNGSVTEVSNAIINLLEGGAEAFEMRASKYGLNALNV